LPTRGGEQLYLFPDCKPEIREDDVILFHIKRKNKETLADQARLEGLSVTGLLNTLIADYLTKKLEAVKQVFKQKTGRGNIDWDQLEKVKELMRSRDPEGVRLQDIAEYCDCSNARARGLIDILSDTHTQTEFLVYEEDKVKPTRYFIYSDESRGRK